MNVGTSGVMGKVVGMGGVGVVEDCEDFAVAVME